MNQYFYAEPYDLLIFYEDGTTLINGKHYTETKHTVSKLLGYGWKHITLEALLTEKLKIIDGSEKYLKQFLEGIPR